MGAEPQAEDKKERRGRTKSKRLRGPTPFDFIMLAKALRITPHRDTSSTHE